MPDFKAGPRTRGRKCGGHRIMITKKGEIVNPSERERKAQKYVERELSYLAPSHSTSFMYNKSGWIGFSAFRDHYDHLQLDLKMCFEHISYSRVVGLLRKHKIEPCLQLAAACCSNGYLMRGSHASNRILDALLFWFDKGANKYCNKRNLIYCRWVDDIIIVGNTIIDQHRQVLYNFERFLRAHGFILNSSKTRLIVK
jgi:hypothetical protein